MIELRWVKRTDEVGIEERVLQYRTFGVENNKAKLPEGWILSPVWADWRDVPTVDETWEGK